MEKLIIAEDTFNVDGMFSDELREQMKKRRRVRAKKSMSHSSDEDAYLNEIEEESNVRQTPVKFLPTYPKIGDFVSSNKKLHLHKLIQDTPTNVLSQTSTAIGSSE